MTVLQELFIWIERHCLATWSKPIDKVILRSPFVQVVADSLFSLSLFLELNGCKGCFQEWGPPTVGCIDLNCQNKYLRYKLDYHVGWHVCSLKGAQNSVNSLTRFTVRPKVINVLNPLCCTRQVAVLWTLHCSQLNISFDFCSCSRVSNIDIYGEVKLLNRWNRIPMNSWKKK